MAFGWTGSLFGSLSAFSFFLSCVFGSWCGRLDIPTPLRAIFLKTQKAKKRVPFFVFFPFLLRAHRDARDLSRYRDGALRGTYIDVSVGALGGEELARGGGDAYMERGRREIHT